ncbi:MAG: HAD-IIIA family hydrolase [Planctomycetes bacterium]|nr:HAD-IIIA family hydrolase [Planctomycetota bacterium]
MRRAVFLDRDGVLVDLVPEDGRHRTARRPSEIALVPFATEAVRLLRQHGFLVIVVTNQPGVAKGHFSERRLAACHRRLASLMARAGAPLDAIHYCPHHPLEGRGPYRRVCTCRKPAPGLILAAMARFGIRAEDSYMVGDRHTDVAAGGQAGLTTILVPTADTDSPVGLATPDAVVGSLLDAVWWILAHRPVDPAGEPSGGPLRRGA